MLSLKQTLVIVSASVVCTGIFYYFTKLPLNDKIFYSTVSSLVVSYVLVFNLHVGDVENYGGPIRNTRKIPMTDCYKFCDTNYGMCKHMYPGDNVGKCDAQWRACRMECYFPNIQRMY